MFTLIGWLHYGPVTTCTIFVQCIRNHVSKFQHHTTTSNHVTASCVSGDTKCASRIILCSNIQLWQLISNNIRICPVATLRTNWIITLIRQTLTGIITYWLLVHFSSVIKCPVSAKQIIINCCLVLYGTIFFCYQCLAIAVLQWVQGSNYPICIVSVSVVCIDKWYMI